MARVIDECRPRYVLGENVSGIVKMELDTVLADLESLGYSARAIGVPAVASDAHHPRHRVWIVAHADGADGEARHTDRVGEGEPANTSACVGRRDTETLAHTTSQRQPGPGQPEYASHPASNGERQASEPVDGGEYRVWSPEPRVGRVADGVSRRVDRLRLLGNSIVPAVAYEILRVMLEGESDGHR